MKRIYKDKLPEGKIEKILKINPHNKHHEIKAKEHAKCILSPYVLNGIRVTPVEQPHIDYRGRLSVSVIAQDSTTNQLLYVDNPLQYVNPPIKVADGTWRKENGIEIENMKEDVYQALKEIIVQTILVLNKK
jgi:hypothetical protein